MCAIHFLFLRLGLAGELRFEFLDANAGEFKVGRIVHASVHGGVSLHRELRHDEAVAFGGLRGQFVTLTSLYPTPPESAAPSSSFFKFPPSKHQTASAVPASTRNCSLEPAFAYALIG